jgi:hypothetical protein
MDIPAALEAIESLGEKFVFTFEKPGGSNSG